MSEVKHTPGPWRYSPEGQMIFANRKPSIRHEDDEFFLCDVRGWGHLQYLENGHEIQDANGYLIAAAPKMIDALIRITNASDLATAQEYAREAIKSAVPYHKSATE